MALADTRVTLPLRICPSRQSRKRIVWPRLVFVRTAMIRRGSPSMRSMMAPGQNSSKLCSRD